MSSAEPTPSSGIRLRLRRVAHHRKDDDPRNDARDDVDEEDVVPREVVGQVSAQGRADGRPDDCAEREDALTSAETILRKDVAQGGLSGCDQAAAERALHDPPKDQGVDRFGKAAKHRGDRESDDRGRIVLPPSEARLKPRGERDDDDRRDDVTRDDPRALVDRCTEVALNDRQRDVDDRRIERLHQRRKHDPDGDED